MGLPLLPSSSHVWKQHKSTVWTLAANDIHTTIALELLSLSVGNVGMLHGLRGSTAVGNV